MENNRVKEIPCKINTIQQMSREYYKLREATLNMCMNAIRVIKDYDGTHRLLLSVNVVLAIIANESNRGDSCRNK